MEQRGGQSEGGAKGRSERKGGAERRSERRGGAEKTSVCHDESPQSKPIAAELRSADPP